MYVLHKYRVKIILLLDTLMDIVIVILKKLSFIHAEIGASMYVCIAG